MRSAKVELERGIVIELKDVDTAFELFIDWPVTGMPGFSRQLRVKAGKEDVRELLDVLLEEENEDVPDPKSTGSAGQGVGGGTAPNGP